MSCPARRLAQKVRRHVVVFGWNTWWLICAEYLVGFARREDRLFQGMM
jgi:hypothetical protein